MPTAPQAIKAAILCQTRAYMRRTMRLYLAPRCGQVLSVERCFAPQDVKRPDRHLNDDWQRLALRSCFAKL